MSYRFATTSQQRELRAQIRDFAHKHILPVAAALDERESFSFDLFQKMAALGLTGCICDQEYGGQGWDDLTYLMVIEELAYHDSSQAAIIASHNSLGVGAIAAFGSQDQKDKILPALCAGEGLWGFALTEKSSGSDAARITTHAYPSQQHPEHWILQGEKSWITGTGCDTSLGTTVLARSSPPSTSKPQYTCFLVPSSSPGYHQQPMHGKMMWRATPTGHLQFDTIHLPHSAILGQPHRGFAHMMATLDSGRLSIAAIGMGLAQRALDFALDFACSRQSFGKPLIEHQGVGFPLADMATRIEASRNLLYKACWTKMQHQPFSQLASMAKLYCSETAEYCARWAQQILGARGLMKDHPLERHFRDSALLRIGEGTSEIQRWIIAKKLAASHTEKTTMTTNPQHKASPP